MKALEKDRNRRYETANGFAADVAALPARRAGAGLSAVGLVPLPQVRPATQARPADHIRGGSGGGSDGRRERRFHLAGQSGPAPGPRSRTERRLLRADCAWRSGNGEPTISLAWRNCSRSAPRTCAAGNGIISSAYPMARRRRCVTRRPSTAWPSAQMVDTWSPPPRMACSRSGEPRPETKSAAGQLTMAMRPVSISAQTGGISPREAGTRKSRSGTSRRSCRGNPRRRWCNLSTRVRSGCGAWTSVRMVSNWRPAAAERRSRPENSGSGI